MTAATRALARGAWTEQFNKGWRFSRNKLGLWPLLLQIGIAALLLWRLEPTPTRLPLQLPVTTVSLLGIVLAFVMGLLLGREELYGKSVLRTLHVSPVSGINILLGLVLAGLPQRLFGSLLLAAVVGWLLPAGSLWWSIPLLWVLALLSSLVGHSAALLALVGWVRVTPRSLAMMWAIAMVASVNMVIILIALLMLGGMATLIVAALLHEAAPWMLGVVGGLVGLPGLVMGVWVALRPGRAGEWYREAYLNMQELGGGRRQTRSSRWPRVLPGAAGALLARQWREIWLNWFTWIRFALMLLVMGFIVWQRNAVTSMAEDLSDIIFVMGAGLTTAAGSFGELLATIGSSDGLNIGLSMVAGVPARQVVKAKWVAGLPVAVFSAACAWVTSMVLNRPDLSLSLATGFLGLGFGVIAMAGGLLDLDPHAEVTEREVPKILRAVLEQTPRKSGAIGGYFGGFVFVVVATWLCHRHPGAALPLAVGCAALAHLALVPGYLHLRRLGI